MKLGPCPICGKDLHYYASLDIEDWKRYDLDCKTKGCLIHELEWNYEDRDKLIKAYNKSMRLRKPKKQDRIGLSTGYKIPGDLKVKYDITKKLDAKKEKPKNNVTVTMHYKPFIESKNCSSWKGAKLKTTIAKDVNCSRCKKLLSKSK
jgi:hypothetical protein